MFYFCNGNVICCNRHDVLLVTDLYGPTDMSLQLNVPSLYSMTVFHMTECCTVSVLYWWAVNKQNGR